MRIPRLSLRWMLGLVAIAALDLAFARHLDYLGSDLPVVVLPATLLAQFSITRLHAASRPSRAFWALFSAVCVCSPLSYYIGHEFSAHPATCAPSSRATPSRFGGDFLESMWQTYFDVLPDALPECLPSSPAFRTILEAMVVTLPTLIGGLVCGLLTHVILTYAAIPRFKRSGWLDPRSLAADTRPRSEVCPGVSRALIADGHRNPNPIQGAEELDPDAWPAAL